MKGEKGGKSIRGHKIRLVINCVSPITRGIRGSAEILKFRRKLLLGEANR